MISAVDLKHRICIINANLKLLMTGRQMLTKVAPNRWINDNRRSLFPDRNTAWPMSKFFWYKQLWRLTFLLAWLTALAHADVGPRVSSLSDEQLNHWAFLPVVSHPLPSVTGKTWVQMPVDTFLLSSLEFRGLSPAPPAGKRTLIRRATIDLLGLPPTSHETRRFLADNSPDAFARLVERLLNSPRYGERWGRHWLDVARYADSNGLDENLCYANAYQYRDYVIEAFNTDLPFHEFVTDQMAGDLLPATGNEHVDNRRLAATGFLALGAKMLAEDDPLKMQMDIIDEQIDTIGRAFLGVWLGCARCHDHKFDPIPTEDYYAMAGIFKSTKTMDNFKVVARWQERPLASAEILAQLAAIDKAVEAKQEEGNCLRGQANRQALASHQVLARKYIRQIPAFRSFTKSRLRIQQDIRKSQTLPVGSNFVEAENYDNGNVTKDFDNYGKAIGVILNRGELPNFAEYKFNLDRGGCFWLAIRFAALETRPCQLSVNGKAWPSPIAVATTGGWGADAQHWAISTQLALGEGESLIRIHRDGPFPHFDKLALVKTIVTDTPTVTLDQILAGDGLRIDFLEKWTKYVSDHSLSIDRLSQENTETLRKIATSESGPYSEQVDFESEFSTSVKVKLAKLNKEIDQLNESRPHPPEVMAVSDQDAENMRVAIRGNHVRLGDKVERGVPRFLPVISTPAVGEGQSGRLQLAQWIADADNPLTSRVIVNRIWRWHFGAGLVSDPDNFGTMSEAPVHGKLLDWLSHRFVNDGWSIKHLHRQIMLSATYQMSSRLNEAAHQHDPDNSLYWRYTRRRMQAEVVRDSILAVTGSLDLRMGGQTIPNANRSYVTAGASIDLSIFDTNRRAVYVPVVRSTVYPMLQAFDFPDPAASDGNRSTSTVATQGLFMLNSPLMDRQTHAMAERLLATPEIDDTERIHLAFQKTLNRPATETETKQALLFLDRYQLSVHETDSDQQKRKRAWQGFCRSLLACNEFIYVE